MQSFKLGDLLKKKQTKHTVFKHAAAARVCSVFNELLEKKSEQLYKNGIRATSFKDGKLIVKTKNHTQAQSFYCQAYAWQ